jgi:hypothetical protein
LLKGSFDNFPPNRSEANNPAQWPGVQAVCCEGDEASEVKDALDNICNPAGSLAAGSGERLHAGRIHSHSARDCAGGSGDPTN